MATRPIDEKIVTMSLDNSEFKRRAEETTGIFGKLKASINKFTNNDLDKTTRDIGNIRSESDKVNFNTMARGIEQVTSKFTNMGIVGITALQNITNRAIDAGINIAKSLSVDQISSGFQEYELKMGSIQTILANTQKHGTTLDDVSKSLNELNAYADQTIYNFGDMTRNIGLFTNAGLKLEESTSMIKGFSNAAAASGTSSGAASNAAYQLSQALSSGYIMQMDWMSLTNAGMGNDNMRRDLIALGQAMGTLNKDTEYTMTNWKDLLSKDKWLTTDVMSTYLQAMAQDLDKADLLAKGLTETQADILLNNAKIGMESATFVRTFSGLMDGLKEAVGSGWAMTFEQIFGDFNEATELWTKLSTSIGGFFEANAKRRNDFLEGVADKDGFLNIFEGIENAAKPVIQIFKAMNDGFTKAFPPKTVDQVVALTKSFKEFTSGLIIGKDEMKQLTTIFQGAFAVFNTIITIATQVGKALLGIIPEGLGGGVLDLLEKIARMSIRFNESVKSGNGLTSTITILGSMLGKLTRTLFDAVGNLGAFVNSLTSKVGPALDWLKDKLAPVGQWFKDAFSDMGTDDLLGAGMIGLIIVLKTKLDDVFDTIKGLFGGSDDDSILDNLKETLGSVNEAIQGFTSGIKIANLVMIAGALMAVAVSLKMLEGIDSEDITKGVTALGVSLGIMMGALAIISKFNLTGGMRASMTLIAIATAVGLLSISLKSISSLDPNELKAGVLALAGIVSVLTVSLVAISKLGGPIKTGSVQLVALATSVLLLTQSVKMLAKIEVPDLQKSIISLGIILAELALFLKVANATKLGPGTALGLIGVATAIQIMVSAIGNIAKLDTQALIKGLTTIAVILAEIAIFAQFAGGPQMILAGVGIATIAAALLLLVPSVRSLGEMSWEELAKGLGGMAVALAAVAGAGLLASGAIGGAIAITIMAGALNLLMIPIKAFTEMTWDQIIKGFIGLGGAMGLVAGAAVLLTPAIPSMLGFSAAVGLLGVAVLAVGAGLALFGAGLATLATLTLASVASIVAALGLLLKGFAELIPAAVDFIVKLAVALIDGIRELVPKLVEAIVYLVVELLKTITKYLPEFLELGILVIVQLLEGIASQGPILIEAAIALIVDLLNGIADAIEQYGPELISALMRIFGEVILLVVEAGVQVVDALFGWIPGVSEAARTVGETAEDYIRSHFGAKELGEEKGKEFNTSLQNTSYGTKDAGIIIAKAGKDGVSSISFEAAGKDAGNSFAAGMRQTEKNVFDSAYNLGTIADRAIEQRMGIRSPAKETVKSGKWTGEGFAKGIKSKGKKVKKTAKDVASEASKAFKEKMDVLDYKFEMGEINHQQHIDGIKKVMKQYSKYPKLVREANLEIKKIEKDMAKEREERAKEELQREKNIYNKRKALIDDRKYYNTMSLKQELDAWERMRTRYKEGTDERKEADREVYRLKKEMYQKMVDLNQEYFEKVKETNQKLIEDEKALNQEYQDAVTSRAQDIRSGLGGIFSEFKVDAEVSGTKLLDNLRSQLNGMMNWSRQLKELAAKGIDEGLLEELRQMGPSAASEINALSKMTALQLQEYSGIWKATNEFARVEAVGELEWLREDTDKQIEQLRKDSKQQLEEYKQEWLKKMREIRYGTPDEFDGLDATMESIGEDAMKGLLEGLKSMEGPLVNEAKSIANSVAKTMGNVLGANVSAGFMNSSTIDKAKNGAKAVKDAVNNVLDSINRDIKVNVSVDGDLPNGNVKMKATTEVPDSSYTSRMLNSINQPALNRTTGTAVPESKNSSKEEIKGLTDAVKGLSDRPQVTKVYLDGKQIAQNVGTHQYKTGTLSALMRG